jgi:polyisoprenoid-binding protein YceI
MKTARRILLVAFTFVLAHASAAEKFAIDPVHSTIGFRVKHLFSHVTGRFEDVSGTITIDPAKPENSSVEVSIATKSVNTSNEKRDTHLRSADFFDVEKFPAMTFKSKSVKRTGEDTADVTGDFTLHGVTKEVTLKVKFLGKGKGMTGGLLTGWEAKTTLKRADYGLVWSKLVEGVSVVGDEVEISLEIEAPAVNG